MSARRLLIAFVVALAGCDVPEREGEPEGRRNPCERMGQIGRAHAVYVCEARGLRCGVTTAGGISCLDARDSKTREAAGGADG